MDGSPFAVKSERTVGLRLQPAERFRLFLHILL